MNSDKRKLILFLYNSGAVKFGNFKLKSGFESPFYIDLRGIISHPEMMNLIGNLLEKAVGDKSFDMITGIPYTALPVASILSSKLNKPLIYQRKEAKAYGTGKLIEGVYQKGDVCLVIDDVMTTGESKIETAQAFQEAGISVRDFIVVIDRSFDNGASLQKKGYQVTSILNIREVAEVLAHEGLITQDQHQTVIRFLESGDRPETLNLKARSELTSNSLTKRLIDLMLRKKSNLVLSLDVDNSDLFFKILEKTASEIVMLKTHVDILTDFSPGFVDRLLKMADEYQFLVFEDRKFADIGSTVRKQYREGIYKIADWAHFVTVHGITGPAIVDGLFDGIGPDRSCFLLAAMSAKDNLITDNYTRRVIEIGSEKKDHVSGFIGFGKTQEDLIKLKNKIPGEMLLLMPGINISAEGDQLGQQYITVEQAVKGGADCIIVGRGIYASENPSETAKMYREEGWKALEESGQI
ncbi:MAG: orotidine-5'-phosphate decarboxylase [Calditrichaceae bacterium]